MYDGTYLWFWLDFWQTIIQGQNAIKSPEEAHSELQKSLLNTMVRCIL